MTIRNSDLAIIGTKAEQQTDLREYADCKPKPKTEKLAEELIQKHAKDAPIKTTRRKIIKCRRIKYDTSCVSSKHLNASRVVSLRISIMPQKVEPVAPQSQTQQGITTSVEQVIATPPKRLKRKQALITTTQQTTSKRQCTSPSITESDKFVNSTQ